MAKPVLTIPVVWAADTLYAVGTYTGQTTKDTAGAAVYARGWYPGPEFPAAANEDNFYWNLVADYVKWGNDDGTDASVELESIVERNALGYTALRRLTIDAATATGAALTVTGGGGSGVGVVAHGAGANSAIEARSHGAAAAITALGDGTGPSGDGVGIDSTGASARQGGIMRGGANADGVQALGTGTGDGVKAFGGTTSGSAVVGTGGAPNGIGGFFQGTGAGDGVQGTGGTTGRGGVFTGGSGGASQTGAFAEATHNDATALHGLTAFTASVLAEAVRAEGRGSSNGIACLASLGHAATFSTGAERAPLKVSAQVADPVTLTADGDLWLVTTGQNQWRTRVDSETKRIHASAQGHAFAYVNNSGGVTTAADAVPVDVGPQFSFQEIPNLNTLTVVIEVNFTGKWSGTLGSAALDNTHAILVIDDTAAATALNQGFTLPVLDTDATFSIFKSVEYTLPADGQRLWQVQVRRFLNVGDVSSTVECAQMTCRIFPKPI